MRLPARAALAALVVLLVDAGAFVAPASAGSLATSSSAAAGVCTTANGVTVVVDMSALGGDIVVRCVKGSGFSGLDALKKAGFSVTGTQQSGPSYVCRIQGRPSATETLPVQGKPGYQEACVVTPPTSAYWGYFYAKNGGGWTYSNTGAASHTVIKGGFEGWAFSLNRAGNPPRPLYTPTRPKAPVTPPPAQPTQPGQGGGDNSGGDHDGDNAGSGGSAGSNPQPSNAAPSDDPQPEPGESSASAGGDKGLGAKGNGPEGKGDKSPDPKAPEVTPESSDVESSSSGDDVQVTGELPADPSATDASSSPSAVPTLIGLGLLVVLGGGAGYTAWRRSHRG